MFKSERKRRDNMPEVDIPEHVRLLIAWIRLIIARGAFVEDESKKSPMRLVDECSLIEQICTHAFAEPNEYIRILMDVNEHYHLQENERFSKDRFIILAAVQRWGWSLYWASYELRGDREIILTAVKHDGMLLQGASKELRGDREIVLTVVQKYGYALQYSSRELRGDRDIVLAAVRQDGRALTRASEDLRDDKEIVLAAINTKYEYALEYASPKLRGDREVVLAAVRQNGWTLELASPELREQLKKEGY